MEPGTKAQILRLTIKTLCDLPHSYLPSLLSDTFAMRPCPSHTSLSLVLRRDLILMAEPSPLCPNFALTHPLGLSLTELPAEP